MQNYKEYNSNIHTVGQVTSTAKNCCTDFTYRFGLRVLLTFQGALLFIIALQANTLISAAIDEPAEGEVKEFNFTRFGIIMIFIFSVIILSYIKEYYVRRHDNYNKIDYDVEGAAAETGIHWAHGSHQ
jgi:hypothetical protein